MLPEPLLQLLQAQFRAYPAVEKVFLYGSRAKGKNHAHSDIDLALLAPAMCAADFARLQYTITYEMPTLLPIEIVRLDGAAADLIERIQQKGVILYARSDAYEKSAFAQDVARSTARFSDC